MQGDVAERRVAVLLADDPGRDFAGSKYLADVGGAPLIDRVLTEALSWPVDDVIVVLGPDAEDIAAAMAPAEVTVVIDPEWGEGSAAPLRAGLDVVVRGPAADVVVVAFADQLGVDAGDVAALVSAASERGTVAAVPKYRYRRGFPVALTRGFWKRLLGLEGAVDLLDLLESHPEGVVEVWLDHLEGRRIDRPDDVPG